MAEGPAIALEGLSKRFGSDPYVLQDISFTASSGEIITVVGPSGCGKTTLLRLIAGLTPLSAGEIHFAGTPVECGYIFQDATLLPRATASENIALPSRLKGPIRSRRARVAEKWARAVGLGESLKRFPRQLSGGMKMRVSIARALSQSPNLLLLDEPFGALDAITRNRLNEELLQLHERSRWTAFFVTHSVSEAVFLSTRIIIMDKDPGRVAAIIENDLPFPRDATLRESIQFQEHVADATARLQQVLSS